MYENANFVTLIIRGELDLKIREKLSNIFTKCLYRNITIFLLILVYFNYIKIRYKNVITNSDLCNMVLEANDIIHGNFFLNDWHLTGLTFITTDLPYYMLSTAVFGISIRSYVYASALMFVVFIISCYLLIKDKLPENKLYIVLFFSIACIPSDFALNVMRVHTADVTLSLVGLYIISNCSSNNKTLTFSSSVLAWFFFTLAVTGDSVCIPFVIIPALCISLINIIRNYVNSLEINKDDIKICIIALLSIVAGKLLEKLYFVLGNANKNTFLGTRKFIALEDIYAKLALYFRSLLNLFNADFAGTEVLSPKVVFYFLGTLVVIISLYSVIWNIWNYLKGTKYDRLALTLSLGFVLISVLCIITNIYVDLGSTRYYATALGILCVILIRTYSVNIKSCLSDMKSRKMTVILSLFLLVFSCHQLLPLPANNYKKDSSLLTLINVLKANNLSQGYSEFWTASSATVYSNNSIKIRALIRTNNKLAQFKWFCKNDWFNEESHFVVVNANGKGQFFSKNEVEQALGKPDKVISSAPYLIYVYGKDISKEIVR